MEVNYFTMLYWFCHTSTWIHHRYTHVPHPEPPSHLPPSTIPLGYPSAPAPSILYHASNLDWQFISYMILYMFQCQIMPPSLSVVIHIVSYFILITDVWSHLPGDSQVAQVVKNLFANAEDVEKWVWSPGQKIPWRRKWQCTPVFLSGKSYGQRSLAGYGPWDCKELDMTECLTRSWLWLRSWIPYFKIQI